MALRLLEAHEARSSVAFGAGGQKTKADLLADAGKVLAALREHREGDVLLCFRQSRYLFTVSLLAVWEAGLTAVLPPDLRVQTVSRLIASERRVALLHDTDVTGHLRVDELLRKSSGPTLERAPAPVGVSTRILTSESTPERRLRDETCAELFAEVEAWTRVLSPSVPPRVVSTLQPGHIDGLLFSVLYPLITGGAFCSETPTSPSAIFEAVDSGQATTLVSVPVHLRSLRVLSPGQLGHLDRVISSTAPLHEGNVKQLVDRHGLDVTEISGRAETGERAWRKRPADGAWTTLETVHVGRGAGGAGDMSSHVGKVVLIEGKPVDLLEQEAWLLEQDEVDDAAVVAAPDPELTTQLLALVATSGARVAHLREKMRRRFGTELAPTRVAAMHRLPRGPNGDLSQRDVLAIFGLSSSGEPLSQRLEWSDPPQVTRGKVAQTVEVPEDFALFQGHFEGYPVMAGVVQLLSLIMPSLRRLHPKLGELRVMDRLKFTGRICPGDTLTIVSEVEGDRCTLSIERAGEIVTAGQLQFFEATSA